MKAKYVGDPMQPSEAKNLPETITAFGVTFERGKYAEVPDDVAAKIAANPHFDTKGEEPEATGPTEEEALVQLQTASDRRVEEVETAARAQIEQMQAEYNESMQRERDRALSAETDLEAERDRADAAEAEVAELRAQLDEATKPAEEAKRGPGRPKSS